LFQIVVEKNARPVVINHDHENRMLERILTDAAGAGGTSGTALKASASHPAPASRIAACR
jgi:hypothetical protein